MVSTSARFSFVRTVSALALVNKIRASDTRKIRRHKRRHNWRHNRSWVTGGLLRTESGGELRMPRAGGYGSFVDGDEARPRRGEEMVMVESLAPDRSAATAADNPFGSALREHRMAAGLTQEELANMSGLSVRAIRNLESGRTDRPQRESVRMLADALQLAGSTRIGLLAFARRPLPMPPTAGPGLSQHPDPDPRQSAGADPREAAGQDPRHYAGSGPRQHIGPCELPPDAGPLLGRDGVVADLCAALTDTGGARLATVTGPPGAGKTAVVLHVAHLLRDSVPDGQIYVDLDGSPDGPMRPEAVPGRVLRALGVHAFSADIEEQAALLRASLAALRTVLVLDNATSEAHIRPLRAGAGRSIVLVAGRRRLPALREGHAFELDGLDRHDATALLDTLIGARRAGLDRAAVHTIARLCEDLPLALHIAGSWLAARPHRLPGDLAGLLADDRRRLTHLQVGDLAVRTSIAACYQRLTSTEQQVLHQLSVLRPDGFDAGVVAGLAAVSRPAAEAILEQLLHAQMISVAQRTADGALHCRLRHLVSLYAEEHGPGFRARRPAAGANPKTAHSPLTPPGWARRP
jgi:transcriptional regulator with XRE-family HTH domain